MKNFTKSELDALVRFAYKYAVSEMIIKSNSGFTDLGVLEKAEGSIKYTIISKEKAIELRAVSLNYCSVTFHFIPL